MESRNTPLARKAELVEQDLKGELLIYDLSINKAYCLNETSKMIFRSCDGNSSVSDISRKLSKQLNQTVTEDLVWLAVDQFKTDNLLAENNEIEIDFKGLSRRQVIRKVGFASMIALPVIMSLVAPRAADAQSGSCVAFAGICVSSPQCCSGAPNCNFSTGGVKRCCIGAGGFLAGTSVNACSAPSGDPGLLCRAATFVCPGDNCCSSAATPSCTDNGVTRTCDCTCN